MEKLSCNSPAAAHLRRLVLCIPIVLCAMLAAPNRVQAVGYRLPNQDPEGIARGNAFVATADNPSAIYYNPAGITQLEGHNFSAGLYFISADTDYTSPTGAKAHTDSSLQAVPQLHYVYSPKESAFSFGFGIYAPFGLGIDWGDNPPFRTLVQEGKVVYASFNPVVAWQLHETLSVGIGPTIDYSQATFKRGIGALPDDQFKFEGDGVGVGFNAGLRWQPHRQWAFGVNYRHATSIDYDGHSQTTPSPPLKARTSTSAELQFPRFVVAGVSYRPTEKWNIEFDIDWTDWDNVNTVVFKGTAYGDIPFVFNYTSSLMYNFGVTRQLGKGWHVSAGYIFSENSVPDRNFNPVVPDSDLHLGSIGFGHRGQRWDWAFGYHFAVNGGRTVKDSVPGGADGKYDTFNNAFNISATVKF